MARQYGSGRNSGRQGPGEDSCAEILRFIIDVLNPDPVALDLDARLMDDLKLYGRDADFFMSTLSLEYGIDMTGYVRADYFHEGRDPLVTLAGLVLGRKAPALPAVRDLRVRDLALAIEQKKFPPGS